MKAFLVQLLRIVLGYVAGALVLATGFFALVYAQELFTVSEGGGFGGPDEALSGIVVIAFVAAVMVSPICLIFIAITEWRSFRRWQFYTASGVILSAIYVLLIYGRTVERTADWLPLAFLVLSAGFSGLAYWAIAGRHAGSWRASRALP